MCRLLVLIQGLFLNPHKPEVGSSSLPRDTINVLLIDTLTALFAVSLSLKFPLRVEHLVTKVGQSLKNSNDYKAITLLIP